MTQKTLHIKPAEPGLKVHLEGKGREFLPDKGAKVSRSIYWLRRLADGSVVEVKGSDTTNKPEKPKG